MGKGLIGNEIAKQARSFGIDTTVTVREEASDVTGLSEIVDITDREKVFEYFARNSFKEVIVAAGIALPSRANADPKLAIMVNAEGPKNIGEAILRLPEDRRPRVIFMGSLLQYDIKKNGPVNESTPFVTDGGAYVQSKNLMVDYVQALVKKGLDAKVAMIFNTTGPGQSTDYFFPAVADQVAKISLKLQEPVIKTRYVGHSRDFTHVSDAAKGILLALKGKSGDLINISSGYEVSLESIIETLIRISGINGAWRVTDPFHNDRPGLNAVWGDNSKLKELGFVPEKDIVDICKDLFEERLELLR